MVHFGTECIFRTGALGIAQGVALRNRQSAHSLPFLVLLYHRVNPNGDWFFPSLSIKAFEAQMRYLAGYFRVRSLGEIVQRMHEGKSIEPWTVALTFDDGYRDNYLFAHPILRRYGLPATVFVPTGYIESGKVLWNDRIAWAVKNTKRRKIELQCKFRTPNLSFESADDRKKAFIVILESLKTYAEEDRRRLVDELIRELQNGAAAPDPMMLSWEELRKMSNDGWEVGSHTVNHAILTKVNEGEARQELCESKLILEKSLQKPVLLFAYPNGRESDFDSTTKALVREAGYEAAVTTLDGFNRVRSDPLEIRRRNPWEEHLPSFALKMRSSYWSAMRVINSGER